MYGKMKEHLSNALAEIKEAGLYKEERIIESPQSAAIEVKGKEVFELLCKQLILVFLINPRLIEGAKKMMDKRGLRYVLCSVLSVEHRTVQQGT